MDSAQALSDSLNELERDLLQSDDPKEAERLREVIGTTMTELDSGHYGQRGRIAQIRARQILRRHLPKLAERDQLSVDELVGLHGLCRRLCMSKRPFRFDLADENRPTVTNERLSILIKGLESFVIADEDPVRVRKQIHHLMMKIVSVVEISSRQNA